MIFSQVFIGGISRVVILVIIQSIPFLDMWHIYRRVFGILVIINASQ